MNDRFPEKPKNIEVKHFNNSIIIEKKWQDNDRRLLLTVCVVFFNLITFQMFFGLLLDSDWRGSLLVLPFLLVTLFLLYYTIALWVNRTYITVDNKVIVIFHKPMSLPMLPNVSLRLLKLENLYLKSQKADSESKTTYQLLARTSNNTDKKLIHFVNLDEALFIKKILKDYLNLKDETQEELGRAD